MILAAVPDLARKPTYIEQEGSHDELASAQSDAAARGLAAEPGIGEAMRSAATVEAALESCDVEGGTAPKRVRAALAAARARLDAEAARPG